MWCKACQIQLRFIFALGRRVGCDGCKAKLNPPNLGSLLKCPHRQRFTERLIWPRTQSRLEWLARLAQGLLWDYHHDQLLKIMGTMEAESDPHARMVSWFLFLLLL